MQACPICGSYYSCRCSEWELRHYAREHQGDPHATYDANQGLRRIEEELRNRERVRERRDEERREEEQREDEDRRRYVEED